MSYVYENGDESISSDHVSIPVEPTPEPEPSSLPETPTRELEPPILELYSSSQPEKENVVIEHQLIFPDPPAVISETKSEPPKATLPSISLTDH